MLGDLLASPYMYLLVAAAICFVGYNIWSGVRESREGEQIVFEKLSELFEKRPESYVIRSLSAPDSSAVGSVAVGDLSAMSSVYSGPNEIFIAGRNKDEFFAIPWDRIDSTSELGRRRRALLVSRPEGESVHVEIPWSDKMTLEGWERHKQLNE